MCCPSPNHSPIQCPDQDGGHSPHTSRLLSVVRSWHWLLSRHQPLTFTEAWSSKANSRAPGWLQHDLGIFQAGWGSAEANKIGGTPARSRTMLATDQEGLWANINNTFTCGAQGFLRTGAVQGEVWCELWWRGGEKDLGNLCAISPLSPVKNQTPKKVRTGSYFRDHLFQALFERWGKWVPER